MDLHLKGKRVLVTGASRGIGLSIALLFAEEGCDLVLVARDEARLQNAAELISEQVGTTPHIITTDLANSSGLAQVRADAGSIDILINNAGEIPHGDVLQLNDNAWRQAWDLKVFGYIKVEPPGFHSPLALASAEI